MYFHEEQFPHPGIRGLRTKSVQIPAQQVVRGIALGLGQRLPRAVAILEVEADLRALDRRSHLLLFLGSPFSFFAFQLKPPVGGG